MTYYLILDKHNVVVKSFTDYETAEAYVNQRPYLRMEEFKPAEPTEEELSDLPF